MLLFDNINRLMSEDGISNQKLAEYVSECAGEKVSRETIRRWRFGENFPPIDKAQIIADYFGLSLDELMGKPVGRQISLPLVGVISAGPFDILNEEAWTEHGSVNVSMLADRAPKECVLMLVEGESMAPYLLPGDKLVVHRQTYAVNGNIIVAYDPTLNGYTVKRYSQNGDTVILNPLNSAYEPMKYTNPKEQELNLYGVCVGLERKLV